MKLRSNLEFCACVYVWICACVCTFVCVFAYLKIPTTIFPLAVLNPICGAGGRVSSRDQHVIQKLGGFVRQISESLNHLQNFFRSVGEWGGWVGIVLRELGYGRCQLLSYYLIMAFFWSGAGQVRWYPHLMAGHVVRTSDVRVWKYTILGCLGEVCRHLVRACRQLLKEMPLKSNTFDILMTLCWYNLALFHEKHTQQTDIF